MIEGVNQDLHTAISDLNGLLFTELCHDLFNMLRIASGIIVDVLLLT